MKISLFGLGYVGAVSAACLAKDGHSVIGVDPSKIKVDLINQGHSPIVEKNIGDMIMSSYKLGRLSATSEVEEAIENSEISMICVGTPSKRNGSLDLKYVIRVCEQIGSALRDKQGFHVVVIRSTMLPGSMQDVVIPTLEKHSGKKAGSEIGICNNPEFLREGTAVYDFYNPPKTVIGETDQKSGDILLRLYADINAPLIRTAISIAEMVKYTDNVWHATKVGFANEIGNICKELCIDSHQVMEIFCQDTKLNLSSYYMKPGFAFGGSCLPKDVRALTYMGRTLDLDLPILNSLLPSNKYQIERGLNMIINKGNNKIGVLGFSFKAGTDDLRESPIVEVVERLIWKGFDVLLYDKNVNLAKLVGANRDYILNRIPHIAKLMKDNMADVLDHADTIVIGNNDPEFNNIPYEMKSNQVVVDLVRVVNSISEEGRYDGICW